MNKLMSIEDCQNWLAQGSESEEGRIVDGFVKQLLDTMRENERLRGVIAQAQSKAHILKYTKNAVSKQCQVDCDKLFVLLTMALNQTKTRGDKC